jgi:hypothetical protein
VARVASKTIPASRRKITRSVGGETKENYMATSKSFVNPDDFDGVIPGRGRKPSPLAVEISTMLDGCPVGMGLLVNLPAVKAEKASARSKIRGTIKTAATKAGWLQISVRWTDGNLPFVVRTA